MAHDFSIERTIQGYRISAMINGYRFSMHYIGYTKREAIAKFKTEIKG